MSEKVTISYESFEAIAKWFLKYHTPVEDHHKLDALWDEFNQADDVLGAVWAEPIWRDTKEALEAGGITYEAQR